LDAQKATRPLFLALCFLITNMNKKLVILDLDETLLHACHEWIGKQPSFVISNAMIHLRPGVNDFIEAISKHFDIAIWTASYGLYTKDIIKELFGTKTNLRFVLTREDCDPITESDGYPAFEKDTQKILDLGWYHEDFIIVDDKPHLVKSKHLNILEVRPFYGSTTDTELFRLKERILSLIGTDLKYANKT
jgi:TFIIF-interacting CTD phosphatase-like protein